MGSEFCECFYESSLFQMNTLPTCFTSSNINGNILDLILVKDPESISNIEAINPQEVGLPKNHHLLEFEVNLCNRQMKNKVLYVYSFKAIHFAKLKSAIQQVISHF